MIQKNFLLLLLVITKINIKSSDETKIEERLENAEKNIEFSVQLKNKLKIIKKIFKNLNPKTEEELTESFEFLDLNSQQNHEILVDFINNASKQINNLKKSKEKIFKKAREESKEELTPQKYRRLELMENASCTPNEITEMENASCTPNEITDEEITQNSTYSTKTTPHKAERIKNEDIEEFRFENNNIKIDILNSSKCDISENDMLSLEEEHFYEKLSQTTLSLARDLRQKLYQIKIDKELSPTPTPTQTQTQTPTPTQSLSNEDLPKSYTSNNQKTQPISKQKDKTNKTVLDLFYELEKAPYEDPKKQSFNDNNLEFNLIKQGVEFLRGHLEELYEKDMNSADLEFYTQCFLSPYLELLAQHSISEKIEISKINDIFNDDNLEFNFIKLHFELLKEHLNEERYEDYIGLEYLVQRLLSPYRDSISKIITPLIIDKSIGDSQKTPIIIKDRWSGLGSEIKLPKKELKLESDSEYDSDESQTVFYDHSETFLWTTLKTIKKSDEPS